MSHDTPETERIQRIVPTPSVSHFLISNRFPTSFHSFTEAALPRQNKIDGGQISKETSEKQDTKHKGKLYCLHFEGGGKNYKKNADFQSQSIHL